MSTQSQRKEARLGRSIVLLAVCAFALPANARTAHQAQQRQQPRQYQLQAQPSSDPVGPSVVTSPKEDYRIGPSDVIGIQIEDAPELSQTFRVAADGSIAMPFLGRVSVHKKTAEEVTRMIADGLRGEYLQDPVVTVAVLQINSRTYFIQGAVRRPGLYQIEGQPSLLKLITVAGGLNENYGSTAFIIREIMAGSAEPVAGAREETTALNGPTEKARAATLPAQSTAILANNPLPASDGDEQKAKYELLKINISGLLRGNFDQNLNIEPGDIIHIPPTDVFFVAGEVNSPGSLALKEGTTLRQAISLAQGTSFNAAADRGIIFREDPSTGKRSEIKVDIAGIMSGKKQDIPILANDIIIVPNSRLKSVGSTLLKAFGVNSARVPMRYVY
ncbi:MAG TPA: polysaccharide biosynthesis/export family protein [Blastocatellia bacterium]|nr:polysaccharide biosynthesis/export family protein [Blastocatellia bacterium]